MPSGRRRLPLRKTKGGVCAMRNYSLAGEWLLWMDEAGEGIFEGGRLLHGFPDTILLPSTTAQAGKTLHGENTARETAFLTEKYPFCGLAWFQRRVKVEPGEVGLPMYLYLERTRMTRVWIDGTEIGACRSICTPHRYEIGRAVQSSEFTVTVCVDNTSYPTKGGHMTSPDTQTNWNGILGRLELQVFSPVDVLSAQTEACTAEGILRITLETVNAGCETVRRRIALSGEYVSLGEAWTGNAPGVQRNDGSKIVGEAWQPEMDGQPEEIPGLLESEPLRFAEGTVQQEILIAPGVQHQVIEAKLQNPKLFSEFSPYLGRLQVLCGETGEAASAGRGRPGDWEDLTGRNVPPEAGKPAQRQSLPVHAVFGFREFAAGRHHFFINGTKTFLRGKHDGMVFPLTGAAPMSTRDWLKVMSISKSFGINHYRFHTCCPPEAAFCAADLLGIYMEPELPFWGTIADAGEEGFCEEEQEYLISEGLRLMETYGSHPSFVMLSLGNELWGSRKRLGEIIERFRAADGRHLYTSGSNNFQFYPSDIPEEDFFAGVRFDRDSLIRGSYAMCDAPQGFVQTEEPNTVHSYDVFFDPEEDAGRDCSVPGGPAEGAGGMEAGRAKETGWMEEAGLAGSAEDDGSGNRTVSDGGSGNGEEQEIEIQYGTGVKKVKAVQAKAFTTNKPVVSHEVGQYCTYPDFGEVSRYTGVLEARNFEVFRERLEAAGMLPQAEEFFRNSGALAAFCYKLELEAAHRSGLLAGYQLLDLQDFPGQGTALVGVLNALMEEKGIISRKSWRGFCGPTLVLAKLPRFVYRQGESVAGNLIISHYGAQPLEDAQICAVLEYADTAVQSAAEISVSAGAKSAAEGAAGNGGTAGAGNGLPAGITAPSGTAKEVPEAGTEHVQRHIVVLRTLDNGVHRAGSFSFALPPCGMPREYRLVLTLEQRGAVLAENSYSVYSYPELHNIPKLGEDEVREAAAGNSTGSDENDTAGRALGCGANQTDAEMGQLGCGADKTDAEMGRPDCGANKTDAEMGQLGCGANQAVLEPLFITRSAAKAKELLRRGLRVLLFPDRLCDSVQGTFCTDFWCYPMFRSISESVNRPIPVGTLGLSIDNTHPALAYFCSRSFSTPQWYSIVTESDSAVLDATSLKPIVQTIDNFERNHKLGLIFEARCMGGRLLVCTCRLWKLCGCGAAESLYRSLVVYGRSGCFCPGQELSEEEFEHIFETGKTEGSGRSGWESEIAGEAGAEPETE